VSDTADALAITLVRVPPESRLRFGANAVELYEFTIPVWKRGELPMTLVHDCHVARVWEQMMRCHAA